MNELPGNGKSRVVRVRAAIALLLAAHVLLLGWGALRNSPTWDEVGHLSAGISHWRFARFDQYRVNPPLVRAVGAVPVILARPSEYMSTFYSDATSLRSEFLTGRQFVEANKERSFWYFTLARWACIPFSLVGAYICWRWARDVHGDVGGIVALTLWCFSPNILAHGQLITPDVGATALGVAAAYCYWRWLKTPSWNVAFVAGLVLGFAQLTKTTWILMFLLWPGIWLMWRWPERAIIGWLQLRKQIVQLAAILLVGLYLINLGYGFEGSFTRLADYNFISHSLAGTDPEGRHSSAGDNRFEGTLLGKMPVPVPKNYLRGIDVQKQHFERTSWSYLRGQWRDHGWWYYYLYGLAVKVPLGTWAIVVLALCAGLFLRGYTAAWRDELLLLIPLVIMLVFVSSQTGFSRHLRYVLPILPFAFIWASKIARSIELRHRTVGAIAVAALAWSVASSLWIYPHSLSYFNESVGGPRQGHAHLLHSNMDWGQDLLYLRRWLDRHPEASPIHVAYMLPLVDPRIAGIDYKRPPVGPAGSTGNRDVEPADLGPKPGWYAISVRELRDRSERYSYFLRFEPVAMAGYSIYIYHITLEEANRVRRVLGIPELNDGQAAARSVDFSPHE